MAEFVYVAPIVLGLIIGILEIFFVKSDEAGMHWLAHGLHALPTCIIFTFIAMNVPFVISLTGLAFLEGPVGTYGIPFIIGIIAAIKVKGAAALTKGGSVGESLPHAIIIGALIALTPFVWPYVAPLLPDILNR